MTAATFREAANCNCVRYAYFEACSCTIVRMYLERDCRLKLASISFGTCIRGYHIYKTVWTPYIGETLPCSEENTNDHDPFAAKVSQLSGEDETIVGHLQRKKRGCLLEVRQQGHNRFKI